MSSSSSKSSAQPPAHLPEEALLQSHLFSLESSGLSNHEDTPAQPPSQPHGSTYGLIRSRDRQRNSISTVTTGATNPANPFSTPVIEAVNPFSPPASVISFSHGDAAATGFGDAHQRLSAHSSLANSAIELQQRRSAIPREAFASPRLRPLTTFQSSGNIGTRTRVVKQRISTMLTGEISKPWVGKKDKAARISSLLTYSMLFIGVIGAALRCYFGFRSVSLIGRLCPVLDDDFNGSDLDTSIWGHEVDLGGFGWVYSSFFVFCCRRALTRSDAGMGNSR